MLQDAIVDGDLPPGTRLNDLDIAEQLGVSRTPVREAIQRLEAVGLVETEPGVKTTVTKVDLSDAIDVFPVVAHLHELAARLGIRNLEDSHIEKMRACNDELEAAAAASDRHGMLDADSAFHRVLVEASGNEVIASLLDRLTVTVRRLEYGRFDESIGTMSAHDHQDIVLACEKRDEDLVASLVKQNWLTLGNQIIEQLGGVVTEDGEPNTRAQTEG